VDMAAATASRRACEAEEGGEEGATHCPLPAACPLDTEGGSAGGLRAEAAAAARSDLAAVEGEEEGDAEDTAAAAAARSEEAAEEGVEDAHCLPDCLPDRLLRTLTGIAMGGGGSERTPGGRSDCPSDCPP